MKLNAYAKINLILNVLGARPDGYHEVEMLMQAISLCDVVTVEFEEPHWNSVAASEGLYAAVSVSGQALSASDFEYGEHDLAWKAALLMAQTFRPELICPQADRDSCAKPAPPRVKGVRISVEKHIPAAAGLAGGSADAAAVLIGLSRLWALDKTTPPAEHDCGSSSDALLALLSQLGARLGSDVPFCLASQLGHPAAIATGTGTSLEFVKPLSCGVTLYFSDRSIPDKTRAVYSELTEDDCRHRYDIRAFLAAKTLAKKRALMGNHLQAPAQRLMKRFGIEPPAAAKASAKQPSAAPRVMLCGAGPSYFSLGKTGPYRTVTDHQRP